MKKKTAIDMIRRDQLQQITGGRMKMAIITYEQVLCNRTNPCPPKIGVLDCACRTGLGRYISL